MSIRHQDDGSGGQAGQIAGADHRSPIDSIFEVEKPAGRDLTTGRFVKGWRGRPKGSLNKLTLLRRALACDPPQLLRQYLESGLASGDAIAMRIAVTRLLPARAGVPVELDLPSIRTAADIIAANSKVIAMVTEARLTPSEGFKVFAMLEKQRRALRAECVPSQPPARPIPRTSRATSSRG